MQIFDSHTHLNDTPYAGQEADFIQQAADLCLLYTSDAADDS